MMQHGYKLSVVISIEVSILLHALAQSFYPFLTPSSVKITNLGIKYLGHILRHSP